MTTSPGADESRDESSDEMELINAEFESMVAGLSLDESSPRTYLDELDELEREEVTSLNSADSSYKRADPIHTPLYLRVEQMMRTIKSWWHRKGRNDQEGDSDGAII